MKYDVISQNPPTTVSATYFVRHFSTLKRSAERAPVYIEAHGKPGWALMSTDLLDSMIVMDSPSRDGDLASARLDAVLDGLTTGVIMVDDALRIARSNPAARAYLGVGADIHSAPLTTILTPNLRDTVLAAVDRVRATGIADIFEIDSVRDRSRAVRLAIMPMPGGVALMADDIGDRLEVRDSRAEAEALGNAVRAIPGRCLGRITPRGAISQADAALVALTGAAAGQIVGARLGTSFDMASRARINALVDAAFDEGRSGWTCANLLAHGGDPRPVALGLAPIQARRGSVAASFIVSTNAIPGPA